VLGLNLFEGAAIRRIRHCLKHKLEPVSLVTKEESKIGQALFQTLQLPLGLAQLLLHGVWFGRQLETVRKRQRT
jgi:hypothetical protein